AEAFVNLWTAALMVNGVYFANLMYYKNNGISSMVMRGILAGDQNDFFLDSRTSSFKNGFCKKLEHAHKSTYISEFIKYYAVCIRNAFQITSLIFGKYRALPFKKQSKFL